MRIGPPREYYLPRKFKKWWSHQPSAIARVLDSRRPINVLCIPTGGGKSPVYMAAAAALGRRAVILTATKALQDQLMKDFAPMGLADIRGRQSYTCRRNKKLTCAEGPCRVLRLVGHKPCKDCEYLAAVSRALKILDEAHSAYESLTSALSVKISREALAIADCRWPPPNNWRPWAEGAMIAIEDAILTHLKSIDILGYDFSIHAKLVKAANAYDGLKRIHDEGSWILAQHNGEAFWEPKNVAPWAQNLIFATADKVILTSATITPPLIERLGVPEDAYDYNSFPSPFPAERRPVYIIPTAYLKKDSDEKTLLRWVKRVDEIIDQRLDRKGILHTVNYNLMKYFVAHTRHANICLWHIRGFQNVRRIIGKFKKAKPPVCLISPCISTGQDFPYDECRYNIIGKLGFPDMGSLAIQHRMRTDPEYSSIKTAQFIQQAVGRGMRAPDDWCENFIIDDNIVWFLRRHGNLFARYFLDSIIWKGAVPDPIHPR